MLRRLRLKGVFSSSFRDTLLRASVVSNEFDLLRPLMGDQKDPFPSLSFSTTRKPLFASDIEQLKTSFPRNLQGLPDHFFENSKLSLKLIQNDTGYNQGFWLPMHTDCGFYRYRLIAKSFCDKNDFYISNSDGIRVYDLNHEAVCFDFSVLHGVFMNLGPFSQVLVVSIDLDPLYYE